MKMTGLILAQSALVGVAVGVYDAGIWLPAGSAGDSWVNGMTYSMGALAVQTIAYYFFKMFFCIVENIKTYKSINFNKFF